MAQDDRIFELGRRQRGFKNRCREFFDCMRIAECPPPAQPNASKNMALFDKSIASQKKPLGGTTRHPPFRQRGYLMAAPTTASHCRVTTAFVAAWSVSEGKTARA